MIRVNSTFSIDCFVDAANVELNFYDGGELVPKGFVTVCENSERVGMQKVNFSFSIFRELMQHTFDSLKSIHDPSEKTTPARKTAAM